LAGEEIFADKNSLIGGERWLVQLPEPSRLRSYQGLAQSLMFAHDFFVPFRKAAALVDQVAHAFNQTINLFLFRIVHSWGSHFIYVLCPRRRILGTPARLMRKSKSHPRFKNRIPKKEITVL
jgi:hypothetical protein